MSGKNGECRQTHALSVPARCVAVSIFYLLTGVTTSFDAGSGVTRALFTPDGTQVLIGTINGLVQRRRHHRGKVRKHTPPRPIAVNAIDIAADGRFVAAFRDASAEVFDDVNAGDGRTLGQAFYNRSPKPAWTQALIVAGACCVGASGMIVTSHFDGLCRVWASADPTSGFGQLTKETPQ